MATYSNNISIAFSHSFTVNSSSDITSSYVVPAGYFAIVGTARVQSGTGPFPGPSASVSASSWAISSVSTTGGSTPGPVASSSLPVFVGEGETIQADLSGSTGGGSVRVNVLVFKNTP